MSTLSNGLKGLSESKETEEANKDEIAPLIMSPSSSTMLKTPRRHSIQTSLNISKQLSLAEDYSTSTIIGSKFGGTSSIRANRQIENAYIAQIEASRDQEKMFSLGDILENMNAGMQVVVDDDFSLCFKRPERRPWNFNAYLAVVWVFGVFVRYFILFPLRFLIMFFALLSTLAQFWVWKKLFANDPKKMLKWELWSLQFYVQTIIASWGGVVEYFGVIAPKKENQIYVANHTTMLDWLLLMQMTPFCAVGQLQSSRPSIAWIQTELLKSLDCIWFNRSEQKDRKLAMSRIKSHIADASKPRLLIFPEGTCVNNEYCIQFKKGAFSLGAEICPVAIKYNPSFIDAYWISRQRSFPMHVMDIMTSWAMVVEVHYLEPQTKGENESDIEFSNRVKAMIAKAGGLKNVAWNGYLKHYVASERVIDASKKVLAEQLEKLYQKVVINDQIIGNGVH